MEKYNSANRVDGVIDSTIVAANEVLLNLSLDHVAVQLPAPLHSPRPAHNTM